MVNTNQYIYLTDVNDPEKVDIYFASQMVDLACVVEISSDSVKVAPEKGIDLSDASDAKWLTAIIAHALVECNEAQAKIQMRTMP